MPLFAVLDHGILTDTQLNDAIAISQSSPGPLGMYVVVVGQFIAGLPGALAGVMALATPTVLGIPIGRLFLRGNAGSLQGACSGIVIASCGLMVVTGIRLAPQATVTPWHAALIVVGTLVVSLTKNQARLDHRRCGDAGFGGPVTSVRARVLYMWLLGLDSNQQPSG